MRESPMATDPSAIPAFAPVEREVVEFEGREVGVGDEVCEVDAGD